MYCNSCGKNNPEGSKFCKYCGNKLNNNTKDVKSIDLDKDAGENMNKNETPYPYVISITKLVVLSIATLGLYQLYWFYKQFKSFKAERGLKWTPWARSLFSGLLSYSLFNEISKAERSVDKTRGGLEAGGLAIVYLILAYSWKLPEPYWWVSMISFLPLIPAQKAINFYWETKYGGKVIPSKFGGWNYFWTVIGGIVLLLALWGTLIPYSTNNSNSSASKKPDNVQTSQNRNINNAESVVSISCDNGYGGSGTMWLDDGFIMTNNHVLKGSSSCLVTIPDPTTGAITSIYTAQPYFVPNLSSLYDLAVLQITGGYTDSNRKIWGEYPRKFVAFVTPNTCTDNIPKLGDSIRIYGYPVTSGGYNLTETEGIISSFSDNGDILTSAKIDSGNSGGLAINQQNGCMLGIPTAVSSGNYQNLGVITPLSVINDFFNKVKSQNLKLQTVDYGSQQYNQPAASNQNSQTNNTDNPPAGGYQNYGWYMHGGKSMQYVDGNWYSTPQQSNATPTPTTPWWLY